MIINLVLACGYCDGSRYYAPLMDALPLVACLLTWRLFQSAPRGFLVMLIGYFFLWEADTWNINREAVHEWFPWKDPTWLMIGATWFIGTIGTIFLLEGIDRLQIKWKAHRQALAHPEG